MDRQLGVGVDADSIASVVTDGPGSYNLVDAVAVSPTLVVIGGSGTVVGTEAEHLADAGAGAAFRDFAGRVGDPVPVVGSDGSARSGADLVALTVEHLFSRSTRNGRTDSMVIAHPAQWGEYEQVELRAALVRAGAATTPVSLVKRPIAALTTALATGRIHPGEAVVVVDIGRRGAEVALVVDAGDTTGRVVTACSTDELGSDVLDGAVLRHVLDAATRHGAAPDPRGHAYRAAMRELTTACTAARRELTQQPVSAVRIEGPERAEFVRIVRAEFESAIREPILNGVATIAGTARQAAADGVTVAAILLVGEAAATPLLTESISAELRIPVVVAPHPEWAVACGAARTAALRRAHVHDGDWAPARPTRSPQPIQPRRAAPATVAHSIAGLHVQQAAPARPPAPRPRAGWPDATERRSTSRHAMPQPEPKRGSRVGRAVIAAVIALGVLVGGGVTIAEAGHGGGGFSSGH